MLSAIFLQPTLKTVIISIWKLKIGDLYDEESEIIINCIVSYNVF